MEGVDKGSTEDMMINGFPVASASANGDQWQFKVYALRADKGAIGQRFCPGAQ